MKTFDQSLTTSEVNLRFTFKPAAVAFPKTPQEVSTIVKIGNALKLRVVARSGGVSDFLYEIPATSAQQLL